MVYHPDPSSSAPPLRAHSHMVIGSGSTDSEALSFTLSDGAESGAGFLKLFLSATYTPMTILEQGPPSPTMLKTTYPANSRLCVKTTPHGDRGILFLHRSP
ncbi:hypothetical protein A0H81_09074 [Grifola frondosa]|uniref:Uncharacterized protein n=1 Tax=Grifola frondosa TaxID=5627 RepID=A0A1C7M0V3_GRIFR|nr:hypothetical protein A0H81_09074 [Grifola frondosa]